MNTFLIGYDLNRSDKDYEGLIDAIKALANGYWHNLDSTWIVNTSLSAIQVRDKLKSIIDSNDELLVVTVSAPAAWVGFGDSASQWLKNNL